MAISIDWANKIISIPRLDLTLIQSTPVEVRELNLNWFRLQLKDLEDSVEGMPFLDTHRHNTEVDVGGLVLARVVEIINDYTITFEDGQYAVNLVGANSNVGDRVNVNQVSIRTSNSAGLISNPAIEYSSYNDGVTIDTNSPYSGTVFPVGTSQQPVNNLEDALLIINYRGFSKIYLKSNLILPACDNHELCEVEIIGVVGFHVLSITANNTTIHDSIFSNLDIYGSFENGSLIKTNDCVLNNVSGLDLFAENCFIHSGSFDNTELIKCRLDGDMKITEGATMSGVNIVFEGDYSTIDMQGLVNTISLDIDSGYFELLNAVTGCLAEFNLRGGEIEINANCISGDLYIEGYGKLYDNGSMTYKANNLLYIPDEQIIAGAVWTRELESTFTMEDVLKIGIAVLAGKTSGGESNVLRFRNLLDTKDRIVATVDSNSNRISVVLDSE